MANWFLMFSMPRCGHCVDVKPDLIELATYFHDPSNSDLNYRVAEIDCTAEEAGDLCVYFGIQKLPKFVVLRPDTDMFYLYPSKDPRNFHAFNHFAMTGFKDAFVYGELPRNYEGWEATYMTLRRQFQVILEDNEAILTDMGLGGLPWIAVVLATIVIFLSPIIVSVQSAKMAYNHFFNPVVKQEKGVEDDGEFVRAKPKQVKAEDAKQE